MQLKVATVPVMSESTSEIEQEIDEILDKIGEFDLDVPDFVMRDCLAYMARCTELHMHLVRAEGRDRRAKFIRTMQLEKVMELLQNYFRGASRMIEVRRQEIELSR